MSSSREARRKAVGDVVTVGKIPPEGARWKADYNLAGKARLLPLWLHSLSCLCSLWWCVGVHLLITPPPKFPAQPWPGLRGKKKDSGPMQS